ncbi:MAG: carotenoid biosynthesis protein [Verrucomicrobiota bacterium]
MRSRRLWFQLIAGWYAIWFVVGLMFLSFGWQPLFNHWEDFLFLALAAAVVLIQVAGWFGWRRTFAAFAWVAIVSGVIEAVGASTGFPFGPYHYTETMGPRIAGLLPLAIPCAWWVVLLPLQFYWSLRLPERLQVYLPAVVGFSAMLVDVTLEPVATALREYWIWDRSGIWYGVPEQNFLGWWLTATLISFGLVVLLPGREVLETLGRRRVLFLPALILTSVLFSFLAAAVGASMWPAVVALAIGVGLVGAMTHWSRGPQKV